MRWQIDEVFEIFNEAGFKARKQGDGIIVRIDGNIFLAFAMPFDGELEENEIALKKINNKWHATLTLDAFINLIAYLLEREIDLSDYAPDINH